MKKIKINKKWHKQIKINKKWHIEIKLKKMTRKYK